MLKLIKTATLSAMIGLGAMAAVPSAANADSIGIRVMGENAAFGFFIGESGSARRYHDRGYGQHYSHDRHDWHSRGGWRGGYSTYRQPVYCSAGEALRKAQRLGLRYPRVTYAGYRTISVEGRAWHHNERILFARAPYCPVLR